MEIRNIVICLLVLSVVAISACTTTREKPQETTVHLISEFDDLPIQLQIKIFSDKSNVSISDSIVFDVNIRNLPAHEDSLEEISVFNPIKLGAEGGLTITVVSPEWSEKLPKEESVEQPVQPAIDDSRPYFVLELDHYVGAIYNDSVKNIFRSPGKYFVFAEYLSPVTEADMKKHGNPRNFWGRELGPVRSAPLEIIVTE